MHLFVENTNARIGYISQFIGKELAGEAFTITSDREVFTNASGIKINYSQHRLSMDECWIEPHPLLNETGIRAQTIELITEQERPAFFRCNGDFPFDIFAASFYLLTRYEEYLPFRKDSYGRYAHQNSLAFRDNFLSIPLVNFWILDFRNKLNELFPVNTGINLPGPRKNSSSFLPTYDIDEAYAFKYKSFWKKAGGLVKSFFGFRWKELGIRLKVLAGKGNDPYDSYQWMDQLHLKYKLKPSYFFIVAAGTKDYDKNLAPGSDAMKQLIRNTKNKYPVGLHPSWQSGDQPALLLQEKKTLEEISGLEIISSRQHYIRFRLPHTFRDLIAAGIEFDFSMGYGSINGFRASVASSFFWYDLENEMTTNLLLSPFCFMDANSFFEQKFNTEQAFAEMKHYYEMVRQSGGTMISIWHNNFLGSAAQYTGWKECYEKFVAEISGHTPSASGMEAEEIL